MRAIVNIVEHMAGTTAFALHIGFAHNMNLYDHTLWYILQIIHQDTLPSFRFIK